MDSSCLAYCKRQYQYHVGFTPKYQAKGNIELLLPVYRAYDPEELRFSGGQNESEERDSKSCTLVCNCREYTDKMELL